jgi:RND superfamily putative drug exporter
VLGLVLAIIILILALGSVLAMGLPVGNVVRHRHRRLDHHPSDERPPRPGLHDVPRDHDRLGVGIDYALLIVTRYREQMHAGHDPRESIGIAIDTAGRSVLFAAQRSSSR